LNSKARRPLVIVILGIIAAAGIIYYYYDYIQFTVLRPHLGIVDRFGVKELNPTKKGGEEWLMNMDDPSNDPRAGRGEGPPTTFVRRMMMVAGKCRVMKYDTVY